jgi:hypothetical protein
MTTQAKDQRYEAFLHGFVAARDPRNPHDTLLALQEAEAAWASYCANDGFSVSLGEAAVIDWSRHETFVREAMSKHETFVHGFVAARAAKVQRLALLALDEAETAWRVHLGHTEAAAHV